ncbi:MAG: hypothetical protein AAF480_05540 [Actinomycetota bacterium]
MRATQGGLGRGLAAIFTGPDAPRDESLRGRFIESALTSLSGGGRLGLCGYVHVRGVDVSVALRSPEMRSLHPTQAYQLFTALGSIAEGDLGRHTFSFGHLAATAVVTEGTRSRGTFFFADEAMGDDRLGRLVDFCSVYAPVIHDHDVAPRVDEHVHLVLDQAGQAAHAEVTVAAEVGFGSAGSAQIAVAQAALAAVAQEAKLVDVGEVRSADGATAFVVAAGEGGRMGTGAAMAGAGTHVAVAVAAVRAGRALRR